MINNVNCHSYFNDMESIYNAYNNNGDNINNNTKLLIMNL